MNPIPPNTSSSIGKSINISSHPPPSQQHFHTQPPAFESTSRRSSSQSVQSIPTPRNNQGQRKQNKNSKKPRYLEDDDMMAETAAMRNANSRRGQTNITHLMNFTLPPRPQDQRNTFQRGSRRANIYGIGSGHHSSDKARYIHANYRFIVKPFGNYKRQAANADENLDWDDVLQILASTVSQDASCPICLSHPVAPRMAKCGHIFCLPCLIRYMHSSEDEKSQPEKRSRWKKCPICWDSVFMAETKPVRWYTGQESPLPKEGDDVVLRLVMREPGSTLALPRDGAEALGKSEDIPWYFAAEVTDYARMMKGSEDYMMDQFDDEITELRKQESEDELLFGEEPEWTRKAVRVVYEAKEKVKGLGNPPPMSRQPNTKEPTRPPIIYNAIDESAPEMYFLQQQSPLPTSTLVPTQSLQTPQPLPTQSPTKSRPATLRQMRSGHTEPHHPDSPYFFYQALLHCYLAPLDIRILKAAFGNFASFPSTLLPRLERVSTGHIMDDDLRKRTKYLSHLPSGCEVSFMECNWTDVVAPEVLEQFKHEIEKRRQRNRDKEYREEKDRIRAEKAGDEFKWAAKRRQAVVTEDNFSSSDFHAPLPSLLDASDASPPWQNRQGSSFATLASPSSSPDGPKTVWGTAVVTGKSPELLPQSFGPVDDGWLRWEHDLVESELIAQVQEVSLNGESSSSKPIGTAGGKKKKTKKITLMSTTARRGL